jgi:hypothetical protein
VVRGLGDGGPDARLRLFIIDRENASRSKDSNNSLRSSLAAGIKTYIPINHYTRNQNFSGAAAVFDDLGDLDGFYKATDLPLTK